MSDRLELGNTLTAIADVTVAAQPNRRAWSAWPARRAGFTFQEIQATFAHLRTATAPHGLGMRGADENYPAAQLNQDGSILNSGGLVHVHNGGVRGSRSPVPALASQT